MTTLLLVGLTSIVCESEPTDAQNPILGPIVRNAVKEIRQSLTSDNVNIRAEAIRLLYFQKHKIAADLMRERLVDPSEKIRILAALSRAIPVDGKVRDILKRGMRFTGKFKLETMQIRYECAVLLLADGDAAAIDFLKDACRQTDITKRLVLSSVLAMVGDRRLKPCILKMLDDKSPLVRVWAGSSLARMGDRRGVNVLFKMLRGKDTIAAYAAESLAELKEKDALPEIRRLIVSDDSFIKLMTAKSMAKLGDQDGVRLLVEMVESEVKSNEEKYLRVQAVDELGNVATARELHLLKPMLQSNASNERRHAAAAILNIYGRIGTD